ncbi:MAG TPA: hypothetical protein VE175_11165, partial [Woeseiaceae bacterium]|nr:hypothetical protein [Woeseiaceae bacterium]
MTTLAAVAVLAVTRPAFAQEDDEEQSRKSAPTISQRTGEKLNEAIEFLNKDDFANARATLADINLDKLSPYERSRVEQIWSGIAYAEGNYAQARQHLQQAINAGGFN